MKTRITVLIIVLIAIMMFFFCNKEAPKKELNKKTDTETAEKNIGKKVVLEINQMKFTNDDFKLFLQIHYGDTSTKKEGESGKSIERILSRLFDSFIEHKTILYIANQYNIPIDSDELNQYIEGLNIPEGNLDKASIIEAIQVQKFLYNQVYDAIGVSDKEIRDYYNQNLEEFRKKPEVFLYQILTKDKETALRIRGRLDNNPQQFEEIARKESISIEAPKGGLMGYFEEGTLPKDMEQVVFSLQPNSISPVVESSYGFHIFKVTQKKRGRLLYIDKVKDEIKQKLTAKKLRAAYEEFLAKASQDLAIKANYDDLYFNYQKIEGDKEDENKETGHSSNPNNSSD